MAVRSRGFVRELVSVDAAGGGVDVLASGGSWDAPSARRRRGRCDLRGHGDAARASARLERRCGHLVLNGAPALVRAARHVRPEEVTFRSSDGLEIGALLFRPADRDAAAPAVVYPHGGPTEFYGDQWDGHAQYFVDKGYAWLALNYRGSTGRGKTFERLNFNDWGGGDAVTVSPARTS